MAEKIPAVAILKPITPSPASIRRETLEYPSLTPAVEKQSPYLTDRAEAFFGTEPGSMEEQRTAQQLALQYMLLTAHKLEGDAQIRGSEQLWSDRYTQATSEIYGVPEARLVAEFGSHQVTELLDRAIYNEVNPALISHFVSLCEAFGIDTTSPERASQPFEQSSMLMGEYLERKYQPIFTALELENIEGRLDMEGLATRFEAALAVLTEEYDSDWGEWSVERNKEKDQLSVIVGSKKIVVGMKRALVSAQQCKGLFAHEVLVHAQRGVNGHKTGDDRMAKGLPGYLEVEEGLGVFFEYAVTGIIPEKNIDRYVDIGLALGAHDATPKTRQQMLDFARTRAYIRNELLPEGEQKTDELIETEVYAHINRIYRGSLGNEYIGVFTKDIAYQVGFLRIGEYIESELSAGTTIDQVIEYLLQGKFDPTNPQHITYIKRHNTPQ